MTRARSTFLVDALAVDGPDATVRPRRELVLAGDVARLERFFGGQSGAFVPITVRQRRTALVVTYPYEPWGARRRTPA